MLKADYSGKFKKDLKLMEKRGLDMRKIFAVMVALQNETPLPPKNRGCNYFIATSAKRRVLFSGIKMAVSPFFK